MRIDTLAAVPATAITLAEPTDSVKAAQADLKEIGQGIKVTLSEQAQAKSAASQREQDVDDSGLPDHIKELIKHIRELKAQIAEKQAELAALQQANADPAQLQKLQQQLSSLMSALTSAYASLAKALKDGTLSDEQKMTALQLSNG
ncbi:hypothetical protein SAMN05216271_0567 [Halopseudomonas sabulinigri]|uniref:Chemotaxis protein n=1 Tax=Halopseudomonas sabulinigri TaxID=472181 RepID=A0A1H1MEU9_9GAMM|nr:hypothetical protein [Halopseudomonas sabulinigri]SDR85236.1 hypothetical protein SAMN05216271_0567 [Halopseudomonas sabulinigri]